MKYQNYVYVDLEGGDVPGPRDAHGAPFIGERALNAGAPPAGAEQYPLSFNQFRLFLKYRLEDISDPNIVEFRIKGTLDTTIDLDVDNYSNNSIFDIRYPAHSDVDGGEGYTVVFTNWYDDEPYKMNVSLTTARPVQGDRPSLIFANTFDVELHVESLDLQTGTITSLEGTRNIGSVVMYADRTHSSRDHHNNKLYMSNCRIFTGDGSQYVYKNNIVAEDVSLLFTGYSDVVLSNNIFYSTANTTLIIQDYFISTTANFNDNTLDYYIHNNILLNIDGMYRINNGDSFNDTRPDVKIAGNIFSSQYDSFIGPLGNYDKIGEHLVTYVYGAQQINQYNFTTPSLTWNILTLTDTDYDYRADMWNVTLNGEINRYTQYTKTYGERDGVGALVFGLMPPPQISFDPYRVELGNDVVLHNSATDFLSYKPSNYIYNIENTDYTVDPSVNSLIYTTTSTGLVNIRLVAESYHSWYATTTTDNISCFVPFSALDIFVGCFDIHDVQSETYGIFDSVRMFVDNRSTNMHLKNTTVYCDDFGMLKFPTLSPNNGSSVSTVFTSVGIKQLKFIIETIDGSQYIVNKTLNITTECVEHTHSNTFYVDLDKSYEDNKKLNLKYGIADDFEDNTIDVGFLPEFRLNYNVEFMYNEHVATSDDIASSIMTGIKQDNFIVEWSFVRDDEASIPKMIVNYDDHNVYAEWDYISDTIIVGLDNHHHSFKYGSYIKDLSCPNALHKIRMKFEYDINSNTLEFRYTMDGMTGEEKWIHIREADKTLPEKLSTFVSINTHIVNGSGLGYIIIQADDVDESIFTGYSDGSERYPFTYKQMKDRIVVGGGGSYMDRYLCRHSRTIYEDIVCDNNKFTRIDVWDPHSFGPWILTSDNGVTDFGGTTLSNGILYSKSDTPSTLTVTNMYDMLVTWNTNIPVYLKKMHNPMVDNVRRSNIIGCTITSARGYVII